MSKILCSLRLMAGSLLLFVSITGKPASSQFLREEVREKERQAAKREELCERARREYQWVNLYKRSPPCPDCVWYLRSGRPIVEGKEVDGLIYKRIMLLGDLWIQVEPPYQEDYPEQEKSCEILDRKLGKSIPQWSRCGDSANQYRVLEDVFIENNKLHYYRQYQRRNCFTNEVHKNPITSSIFLPRGTHRYDPCINEPELECGPDLSKINTGPSVYDPESSPFDFADDN